MICAHCKTRDVNVAHVRACSKIEQSIREIGKPDCYPVYCTTAEPCPRHATPEAPNLSAGFQDAPRFNTDTVQNEQDGTITMTLPDRMRSRPAPSLATLTNTNADIEGVYVNNGSYYKVQVSPNTGNAYAKEYDASNEVWEYRGRKPLHFLTLNDKVTAEQAARFGHVTGQCVNCGKKLTDERSISVGYGPTCAANNGWPWGQ